MGVFNFKSVGKTQEQKLVEEIESTKTPIGIKTPLQLGDDGKEIFVTYNNLADTVHDNLRNLLLTNWGERLGLYDFGANLRSLTTEYASSDDFDNKAIAQISNAVSRWMSYVALENYISTVHKIKNLNVITITITYNIISLGVTSRKLEINLYVI
jgi:phage baseplate assembly protein W